MSRIAQGRELAFHLCCIYMFVAACVARAAPNITGVSISGQQITIAGSWFGAKSPAAPLKWDNFENGTIGGAIATNGWKQYGGVCPTFTNLKSYSGAKCTSRQLSGEDFNGAYLTGFGNADRVYVSLYFNWEGSGGKICKWIRLNAREVYRGNPRFAQQRQPGWFYEGYHDGKSRVIAGGVTEEYDGEWKQTTVGNEPVKGQWSRMEVYWKLSATSGVVQSWVNLKQNMNLVNVKTRGADDTSPVYSVLLPLMVSGATSGDAFYVDDVYIDVTPARVEIGNAAQWAACTKREPQIPTQWSDGRIVCQLNLGKFNTADKLFLFVVDPSGNPTAAGYPIFGANPDDTLPSPPTNLQASAISATQINLTWKDNSNNETGFAVEKKINPTSAWAPSGNVAANVTSYSSTGLGGSHTFYFRVYATSGVGSTSYSNEASATTLPTTIRRVSEGMPGPERANGLWPLAITGPNYLSRLPRDAKMVVIYDVTGRTIWQYRSNSANVITSPLPTCVEGVFFLKYVR